MNTRIRFQGWTVALLGILAGCDAGGTIVDPPLSVDGVAGAVASSRFTAWSTPVNLGPTINSPFTEFGAAMSNDGLSLYFASPRPGGLGGNDLWVARRARPGDDWGAPANLGPPVNSRFNDAAPNLSRDGHLLLFTSNRPGGSGGNDLWASRRADARDDLAWEAPANLGPRVNGPGFDAGPHLRLPELYLASDRASGTLDIFVSRLGPGGVLGAPVLVSELNSEDDDARPSPRFDGLEIFFHSSRPGGGGGFFDIWMSTRGSNTERWSDPASPGRPINTEFAEVQPFISGDGRTLLFASDRPGGSGGLDLYMASRSMGPH
ncbi:MAG: hypothetical protein KY466_16300 [Gemmatimonadetes bacterium]|nr:hypothetical protein [Gemmatimonadota bacterium]